MDDYGTEVKLLAVTTLTQSGPIPLNLKEGVSPSERLIEYSGRLCYNVEGKTGTKPGWTQDRIKDGHESILEHASATFLIKASRVFTHELVRHRIASYSQRSQRYVNESEPKYITPPEMRKSGFGVEVSKDMGIVPASRLEVYTTLMEHCWTVYRCLIKDGVPKEIARYVLPNACETQIVVTMNFRELRHFIKIRTSPRALPEMREVANKVKDICKEIAPEVFADI